MIHFLLDSATINRLPYNCGGIKREKISMRDSQIDDIVRARFDSQGLALGVAVAVVKNGSVVHCQGYGLANLEWRCPITPETVFRLGSISKPMTAQAILLLEQQGKLSLDDALTQYLPAYPMHGYTISLRHLLTHTSGIPCYTEQEDFGMHYRQGDLSHDELLSLFKDLPLECEPGTRYNYSNSGYYLLGMIIETVSGKSYGEFVHDAIFEPLGMVHSCYMDNEPIILHRAEGYRQMGQVYQHSRYISMKFPFAAGALGSTLEDLIRWDAALREGRLLDQQTQQGMYTRTKLADGEISSYGYGWGIDNYHGRRRVGHGGGISGFSTYLARFVDDAATVILLSNIEGLEVGRLGEQISQLVLALPPSVT
jgi:CubicO group peptidase (beta-lactamase class C family)